MEPLALLTGLFIITIAIGAKANTKRKEFFMTETAQQEAIEVEFVDMTAVKELMKRDHTVMSGVEIYGSQLVSQKLLDVVHHTLSSSDWGVTAIIFNDEMPKDKLADIIIDEGIVLLNLKEHWQLVVEKTKMDDNCLSLRASLWLELLMSVFHEASHAKALLTDPEAAKAMSKEEREEAAEGHARDEIENLGIGFNIEPPSMADEPYFGTRYMQLFIDRINTGKEDWAVRQANMHDEQTVYLDEANDLILSTFREYLRASRDPKEQNQSWDKTTPEKLNGYQLPVLLVDEAGIAAPDAAKAKAADEADKPAGEAAAAADPLTEQVLSMDMIEPEDHDFNNAPWDVEAVHHLSGNTMGAEEAAAMDPIPPAVQTAAPIAPAPAVETAAPAAGAKFCTSCGAPVSTMFCGSCGTRAAEPAAPASEDAVPWTTVEQNAGAMANDQFPPYVPPASMPPGQTAGGPAYRQPPPAHKFNEPLETNLPPTGLTRDQKYRILMEIYRRCNHHIFTKCGFQMPLQPAAANKDAFDPNLRLAVLEPISIADIPGADRFVIGCRTLEPVSNEYKRLPAQGSIAGHVFKNALLPGYTLYFNDGEGNGVGFTIKRVFCPQNCWKTNNAGTNYSEGALLAQQGHQIAWIFDGADQIAGSKWKGKMKDGVYCPL